jgi:hypothetical protein
VNKQRYPYFKVVRKGHILESIWLIEEDGRETRLPPHTGITYSHEASSPGHVALAFHSDLVRFSDV